MALDPSIILGAKPLEIQNPMDVALKGLTLKQMANQNTLQDRSIADDQAVRDAFSKNTTTDPATGMPTVNRNAALSQLAQTSPQKAMDYQKLFQGQDLEKLAATSKASKELLWQISDDGSNYGQIRQKMIQMGLPNAEQMPEQYLPNFVKNAQVHSLEGDKQVDMMMKQKELDRKTEEFGIKREENSIKRSQLNNDRTDKLAKDFKNDMDADKGRSGNFGQISAKVQSAERLEGLVQSYKDGNLPPAQMEELALGAANMLAGSNGTSRQQVEALVPKSFVGDANKIAQWVLNDPRGAGQQAFVEATSHMIGREKGIATDQLNSIRASRLPFHDEFRRKAPGLYNQGLQSYGIDPANIKNGKYVPPPPPPSADEIAAEVRRRGLDK